MGEPLAFVQDIVDLWRPLTTAETDSAINLISKASALLRQATRQTVDSRIARFEANPTDVLGLDREVVATVVAGIVKRYMANPDGVTNKSVTIGPYSETNGYALKSDKDPRGVLIVTDEDLEKLAPDIPIAAGSIQTASHIAVRRPPNGYVGNPYIGYPLSIAATLP